MAFRTLFIAAILMATGCNRDGSGTKAPAAATAAAQPSEGAELKGRAVSVNRRRAIQIRDMLAKALTLHPQALCLELGKLPCADVVHRVSLGGVNAYANSQYKTTDDISITAPISFDRIVLSACLQRAQIDLSNTKIGVIYKDVSLTPDGRLVDDEAINSSIDNLYKRALTRLPTDTERQAVRDLYKDIYAKEPVGAARNWMVLACYSVLTSAEAAFY